jgi:hypothetical protein
MVLEPTDCQIMQLVVRTVKRFITSSDRLEILTGEALVILLVTCMQVISRIICLMFKRDRSGFMVYWMVFAILR